ncbi:hypothetical protein J5X84_31705 [Streptosporangiaceae bacterium NEAU-GS5]|nr:hypothetical protein [Streptosporangiaceae bacterium NEAU-GS5]
MFSGRRGISGDDCLRAAFPADSLQGLAEAITAVERAHPSAAVSMLVASLNPYHWRSSRSAAAGLREQGRAALRAGPALAGWLKLCVGHGVGAGQQDGINDALYRLSQLRAGLDEADPMVPQAALDRVRRFFDEVFQPYLLTLLVPPVRYWQRGVIGYLDGLNGDLEAVAAALQGFVVALREHTWGSGADSDWDEYTHSETLALIGRLGPHLDRRRVERDWLAQPAAEPALLALLAIEPVPEPVIPHGTADAPEAATEAAARLLALAGEDADPDVRAAALHAMADAGGQIAGALEVALRAAAADDSRERAAAARLLAMLIR